ncbi:hypothetical protein [Marinifilum breve]|uniref:hypothetical protein n=1 Tax=Marinifilum breve TaxID=2184082 RepID=UPI0014036371|nr:hypothetical protein [Marinifilum breve]
MANKTIEEVPLARNRVTTLSGKMFENSGSSEGASFTITINSEWDSPLNKYF